VYFNDALNFNDALYFNDNLYLTTLFIWTMFYILTTLFILTMLCILTTLFILTIEAVLSDVVSRQIFLGAATSILSAYSKYFIHPFVCKLE
jgi:hypothetical protein